MNFDNLNKIGINLNEDRSMIRLHSLGEFVDLNLHEATILAKILTNVVERVTGKVVLSSNELQIESQLLEEMNRAKTTEFELKTPLTDIINREHKPQINTTNEGEK